jgi:hypothetical protein
MESNTILGIAAIIACSLLAVAMAQAFAADQLVNPNPPAPQKNTTNTNSTSGGYLFGCKDGVVLFAKNGLNMGCVVAPFNFKAFNGTDIKTYNNNNNGTSNNNNNGGNAKQVITDIFGKYCHTGNNMKKDPVCKALVSILTGSSSK